MIAKAVNRMQKLMNSYEKVVICTTDDRKIEVNKDDKVFAEGNFLMIIREDEIKSVNANHVTYMSVKEYVKTSLSIATIERVKEEVL